MSHREALERIQSIERNCNLPVAEIDGLHVWPIIRLRLFARYCFPFQNAPLTPGVSDTGRFIDRAGRHLGKVARAVSMSRIFPNGVERTLKEILLGIAETQVLFFSRQMNYQDIYNGESFDRYVDPLYEFARLRGACAKLWLQSKWMHSAPPPLHAGVVLPAELRRQLTDVGEVRRRTTGPVATLSSRLDELHTDLFGTRLELESQLVSAVGELLVMRDLFSRVLQTVRPRLVMFPCYYAPQQTAMIAACRSLGITTVDIQHGKQGPANVSYNHWTSIPEGGFNTVPDQFWVWNRRCAENITIGRGIGCQRHNPIVGGNLFLKTWHDNPPVRYRDLAADVWRRMDNSSKSILVTLQPLGVERMATAPIWSCMCNGPDDWFWIIKVHPNDPTTNDQWSSSIAEWSDGATNFLVLRDATVPLYGLMREVDAHVTYFSTTCFEALAFGLRSIVIGREAKELYAEEIDEGVFLHVGDDGDLLPLVCEARREVESIATNASYDTDNAVAEMAFESLMQVSPQG